MKCAGCIATEIHQCYRKGCTCMDCNPCSLTVGNAELLARVAALEAGIEDFAKVAEQTGQPGTAIGLRALLPAPPTPESEAKAVEGLAALLPTARDPIPPGPGDCQYRDALLVANKRRHEAQARAAAALDLLSMDCFAGSAAKHEVEEAAAELMKEHGWS